MSSRGTRMPNLGEGNTITLGGKDDALAAYYVLLDDILTGVIPMAFDHPRHLYDFLVKLFPAPNERQVLMIAQAEIVSKLAQARNYRIMSALNARMADKPEVVKFPLGEPGYEQPDIEVLCAEAIALGVCPDKYMDTTHDDAEEGGCCDPWSMDQRTEHGKAADNIQMLDDLDGEFWVLVIDRAFAPGTGCVAFAEGLLNSGESYLWAAIREFMEEVSRTVQVAGGIFLIILPRMELEAKLRTLWDPRLRFPHGMIVGGTVELIRCVKDMAGLAACFGLYAEDFEGMTPEGVCELLKIDPATTSGQSIMAAYSAFQS